jgi:hypothetical protein
LLPRGVFAPQKGFAIYSKYLEAIYLHGQTAHDGNTAEKRMFFLYQHKQDMPPWTWDYDHYAEDNKDMVGFFYKEDLENINIIDHFIMMHGIDQEKTQKLAAAAERAKTLVR